jgi:hypothetical protein
MGLSLEALKDWAVLYKVVQTFVKKTFLFWFVCG